MKSIRFLAAIMFFLPMFSQTYTDVSGGQNGTWTKLNSPYRIVGAIRIGPDSSLTIEPGVEVVFALGGYGITVYGNLDAQGTITDSIVFRCQYSNRTHSGILFDSLPGAPNSATGTMTYCRLENAQKNIGAAIWINNSSPVISHCLFKNNSGQFGGAVYITRQSQAIVEKCIFHNNTATYLAGALGQNGHPEEAAYSCNPIFRNNIIYNNQVTTGEPYGGAGISIYKNFHGVIENNLIYNNSSAGYAGGIMVFKGTVNSIDNVVTIRNCIIRDNSAVLGDVSISNRDGATVIVEYSDISGGYAGTGNIDIDPMFEDVSNKNFHLKAGSPCIDSGTSVSFTTDADDNFNNLDGNYDATAMMDIGPYEFETHRENISTSNTSATFSFDNFQGAGSVGCTIALNGAVTGSSDVDVDCFTKSIPIELLSASNAVFRFYRVRNNGLLSYITASITLYYSDQELALSGLSESNLFLYVYRDNSWHSIGGVVNANSNSITASVDNIAGTWVIADMNDVSLPVVLSQLNGYLENKKIIVSWTTESEINNSGYELFQIRDGQESLIASYRFDQNLRGAGNSNSVHYYRYSFPNHFSQDSLKIALYSIDVFANRYLDGSVSLALNENRNKPVKLTVSDNFPNPFNPQTSFNVSLNERSDIRLVVFNIAGQKIAQKKWLNTNAGEMVLNWKPSGLASGVYFYQIAIESKSQKRSFVKRGKMVFIK